MTDISSHIKDSQAKFFQHFASQGERIGQLTSDLLNLDKQHELMSQALVEK